jgi:hypothetical protein
MSHIYGGKRRQLIKNSGSKRQEPMEFIRRNISEVLADLPEICAAHLPSDNSPILIKRGKRGYCQRWEAYDGERFNKHHGITDAQVGAMLAGSMFGFDCPGADPLNH